MTEGPSAFGPRGLAGAFLVAASLLLLAHGESKYAGDRDVRYLNCLALCSFECDSPGQRARWYTEHISVTRRWRDRGMYGSDFDMHQYKDEYLDELSEAVAEAATDLQHKPKAEVAPIVSELLWFHRILKWTCQENCKYECMIENRELRRSNGEQPVQYKGKWAFTRVVGIQEFFSTFFSLMNGLPYLLFLIRHANKTRIWSVRGGWVWFCWLFVSINTWVQSAIFHARDNPTTEFLDYAGASMLLTYSLGLTTFLLLPANWSGERASLIAFSPACLAFLGIQFVKLVISWYGLYMVCCVCMGSLTMVNWIVWFVLNRARKPYAWKVIFAHSLVFLVLPFELLDFPPISGLLDAHAIWHALTVPAGFFYVVFVTDLIVESDVHED